MAPHTPPPSLSLQLAEFTIASVAIVVMSLAPILIPICIFSFPGGFPLFPSSPYYVREKKGKGGPQSGDSLQEPGQVLGDAKSHLANGVDGARGDAIH